MGYIFVPVSACSPYATRGKPFSSVRKYAYIRSNRHEDHPHGIYASTQSPTSTVGINVGGTIITHSDAGSGDGSGIVASRR